MFKDCFNKIGYTFYDVSKTSSSRTAEDKYILKEMLRRHNFRP